VITAEDLLAGPRGRRFCTELLHQVLDEESGSVERLREVLFWAGYHLDRDRGESPTLFGPGADRPAPAPGDDEVARALSAAVDAVDPVTVRADHVVRALTDTAAVARYWQEPDSEDVLLVRPSVVPVVTRLAGLWAASTAVDTVVCPASHGQWSTTFDGPHGPEPLVQTHPGDATRVLGDWRRALQDEVAAVRPGDRRRPVDASLGGEWWSTPPSRLLVTTPDVAPLGPLGLWAVEDDMGWERAVVAPVSTPVDARVLVIDGADDWSAVCRRWPIDVSWTTRRHDWYRTTGRDGAWVTPDWSGVAAEYDAVRLTVRGWLRAAGTAVPVPDGSASVVAGWTPGSTVWLRDPVPAVDQESGVVWTFDNETLLWTTGDGELLTDGVFPTRS
jgi:hypothetical protein